MAHGESTDSLSAISSSSAVVVKSADSTIFVFFCSVIPKSILTSGLGCVFALSIKVRVLREAIVFFGLHAITFYPWTSSIFGVFLYSLVRCSEYSTGFS